MKKMNFAVKKLNLVEKIEQAWSVAKSNGTTGIDFKLATNEYNPHEVDTSGANKRMTDMWQNDVWREGTAASNKKLREEMYKTYNVFGNVKKMIEEEVVFINQGEVGGCFFASILNLLQLGGKKVTINKALTKYKKQSLAKLKREANFKNLYRTQLKLFDCGYGTYYLSLKQLPKDLVDLTKDIEFEWFRYKALPRPAKRKTGSYNKKFDAKNIDEYNEKVLAYLRNLMDNGYVFAAPFNGHFVAYIGYNDKGFLALGSYGESADKGGLHEVKETILLADAINSILYMKVPDMTMEELSKQVKMITVEEVAKEAKETMKEIQKARTRRGRKKLSENKRAKLPKKKKKAPKKKKKGKMTLRQYKISVEAEVKDMKKLLKDSAEQRESQMKSIIINRRRTDEKAQLKSINETLQACVCVESNGSGSIVTHNGKTFVLTNEHVASEIGTIKFIMWIDGKIGYAQTYWVDEENDIGKMKIIDSPKNKVISSLSIHSGNVKGGQLLVQIHNPYHWYNDEETGDRQEIDGHFPFTVETRNIHPGKLNDFSHSSTEDSSVFGGSSGSPLIYRDTRGILGGVVGIHKQYYYDTGIYEGVLINDTTLNVLPKLKF